MSDWSRIPAHIIAIATDRHGRINGFTAPPAFHGPTGEWKAASGGTKENLWLSKTPPGDAAGNTVEYRPGHDPGVKRPKSFGVEISQAETPLGQANLAAIAKAQGKTIEEVRDPKDRSAIEPAAPVPAQYPKRPTEKRADAAQIIDDDGSTMSIADVGPAIGTTSPELFDRSGPCSETVGQTPDKPATPTFFTGQHQQPVHPLIPDACVHPLHVGDWTPGPQVGDPVGPPPYDHMRQPHQPLCPPSFQPTFPAPGPDTGHLKALLDGLRVPSRESKIIEILDLILQALGTAPNMPASAAEDLAAARALVATLLPPPELTKAEKDVLNQLKMLDDQAQQMRDAGKLEEFIATIQDPMRSFLAGIKESREAKLAQGARL